jgi:hypothetical protein
MNKLNEEFINLKFGVSTHIYADDKRFKAKPNDVEAAVKFMTIAVEHRW